MADNEKMIDDRTKGFLDVEEMARRLASRLSRLDEEANRYAGAAKGLNEAAQATRDLVKVVHEVGDSAAKAIEVIASVGGPEIVKRLSALESQESKRSAALLKKVNLAVILAGATAVLALAAIVVALMK